MSVLRQALHQCAELLADAMETPEVKLKFRKPRVYGPVIAPIPDLPISPEVKRISEAHARKHGLI